MIKNELVTKNKKEKMKNDLDVLSEFKGLVDYSNVEVLYEYLEYCDNIASITPEAYKMRTSCKVSSSTLRKWVAKYLKGYRLSDYINISDLLYMYLLDNPYPNCTRDTFDNKNSAKDFIRIVNMTYVRVCAVMFLKIFIHIQDAKQRILFCGVIEEQI